MNKDSKKIVDTIRYNVIRTLLRVVRVTEESTFTYRHSDRVATVSRMLGVELGLPERELDLLWRAALLHDIGKMGIDKDIVLSPHKLSNKEYDLIKNHSIWGEDILRATNYLKLEAKVVRHHHERYDGNGYPDGLAGKDIHIFSRIISLADVYDALVSVRPYRNGLTHQRAVDFIQNNSEIMFDPTVVDLFLRVVVGGEVLHTYKNYERYGE